MSCLAEVLRRGREWSTHQSLRTGFPRLFEVEVHLDSGSETVSMGDVEQVREVESDEDTQSCSVVSGEEEDISEDPLDIPAPPVGVVRAAFLQMDEVDLVHHFSRRAVVMKVVPRFLKDFSGMHSTLPSTGLQDVAPASQGWCDQS